MAYHYRRPIFFFFNQGFQPLKVDNAHTEETRTHTRAPYPGVRTLETEHAFDGTAGVIRHLAVVEVVVFLPRWG